MFRVAYRTGSAWAIACAGCFGLGGCAGNTLFDRDLLAGRAPSAPPPSLAGPGGAVAGPPTRNVAAGESPQQARAAQVLARLLTANAQIPVRPTLVIRDSARPAILHNGQSQIIVSAGLIERCPGDEALAGALALELAKMTVERLERAQAAVRGREAPLYVPIGRDFGSSGESDPLYRAEIAQQELERPRKVESEPIPDPKLLARQYLSKAGYAEGEVETVPARLSAPSLGDPRLGDPTRLPPQAPQPRTP